MQAYSLEKCGTFDYNNTDVYHMEVLIIFWWIMGLISERHMYQRHLSAFVNSSPSGQNGRHFADDIFRCIFGNEKFSILIKNFTEACSQGPN